MLQTTADRASAVLATQTDSQLVEGAVKGNEGAFDELYRRHSQSAWRLAQATTRNAHDAADAVSEAFVKVLTAVGAGQLREGTMFRSYLLTTTRRCAIDVMRRHGRTKPTDDDATLDGAAPHATPPERLEGGEDAALVAEAFRDLPERWRSVLWLTEVEGMKPREAAEVLGLTPNGTAQLAVRARAGLRERYLQAHLREATVKECQFTVERLGAYVAGALSPRELAKVDQHLAGCEECRHRRDELNELRRPLRLALIPIPLALGGLAADQFRASLASSGRSIGGASWVSSPPPWAQKVLAGAAAAVFAVGAITTTWLGPDDGDVVKELAAPAAAVPDGVDYAEPELETTTPLEVSPDAIADLAADYAAPRASAPVAEPEQGEAMPATPPVAAPEAPASDTDDPLGDILDLLPGGGSDESEDPGGGGGTEETQSTAEVGVGGRSGDDTLSAQLQVGGDDCTGVTAGDTALGCETTAPEEDGIEVSTGGELLPEQDLSLP